jgi:hypothetical protein
MGFCPCFNHYCYASRGEEGSLAPVDVKRLLDKCRLVVCRTLSAAGQVRRILFQSGGQDHSPNNQTLTSCCDDMKGYSATTCVDPVFKKSAGVVNMLLCVLPLPARSENARRWPRRAINTVSELRYNSRCAGE